MMNKHYYGVSVEKYQKMDRQGMHSDMYIPVDLNGGFVPLNKSKRKSNLKKAAYCIKARFGLE